MTFNYMSKISRNQFDCRMHLYPTEPSSVKVEVGDKEIAAYFAGELRALCMHSCFQCPCRHVEV